MNLLIFMDSVKFFSIKRLKNYKNEQEHKRNFASAGWLKNLVF